VRRLKRSKIRVILGDHDQFMTTETEAIQRAVSAIIRHRNFDQNTYNHDIALLRLRKPVTFTKSIQPVCLPKESIDPSGKSAIVIGEGVCVCGVNREGWFINIFWHRMGKDERGWNSAEHFAACQRANSDAGAVQGNEVSSVQNHTQYGNFFMLFLMTCVYLGYFSHFRHAVVRWKRQQAGLVSIKYLFWFTQF
jgi:hypothetical protein